jgi:hypothetical protein
MAAPIAAIFMSHVSQDISEQSQWLAIAVGNSMQHARNTSPRGTGSPPSPQLPSAIGRSVNRFDHNPRSISALSRFSNCVCGLCIGIATCVPPITAASDKHCEPISICRAATPEHPHGGENEPKAPPIGEEVIVTALTSAASSLSEQTLLSGKNFLPYDGEKPRS